MSLPPGVKTMLKAHGHTIHQKHIQSVRANHASSANIIRHSAARQVDEVGPEAAMAIDKILALPPK